MTRLGPFSKMVICGDPDQSDIRGTNGLCYLTQLLEQEGKSAEGNGCFVCRLEVEDIQRNRVIPYLLHAFARHRAKLPLKKEVSTYSSEARLAALLERTMEHLIGQQETRPSPKPRNGRVRADLTLQGDLFDRAQSVILQN